jgi:hypothetical protein
MSELHIGCYLLVAITSLLAGFALGAAWSGSKGF